MICKAIPLALAFLCASPVAELHVIDGDTLASGARRIRLMGFDAPESRRAKCPAEKVLGVAAKFRMQSLIARPDAAILPSGKRDRYGRELARLIVGGEDAAVIMVREGLAHRYSGGRREGWC